MRGGSSYHNYETYPDKDFDPDFEIDGTLYCKNRYKGRPGSGWWCSPPSDRRISLLRPVLIQVEKMHYNEVKGTNGQWYGYRTPISFEITEGMLLVMVAIAPIIDSSWFFEAVPLEEAHEYI